MDIDKYLFHLSRMDLSTWHTMTPVMTLTCFVPLDDDRVTVPYVVDFSALKDIERALQYNVGMMANFDEALITVKATIFFSDDDTDIELPRQVLELTVPSRRGWMMYHTTLTGVEHYHLCVDGRVHHFAGDDIEGRRRPLDNALIGLLTSA